LPVQLGILLGLTDELVLSTEVFNCALFAGVLGLQDFDFCLELDCFFFRLIILLFEPEHFFVELFAFFGDDWVCLPVRVVGRACLNLSTIVNGDLLSLARKL